MLNNENGSGQRWFGCLRINNSLIQSYFNASMYSEQHAHGTQTHKSESQNFYLHSILCQRYPQTF